MSRRGTHYKGMHRKSRYGSGRLARRSFLLGGGVVAAGTAVTGLTSGGSFAPWWAATVDAASAPAQPPHPQAVRRQPSQPSQTSRTSRDLRPVQDAGEPRVHTTQEWGARGPDRQLTVLRHPPRYIVVHHTFTANATDPSADHGFWLARAIQKAHLARGWPDTGQHFTISRGGHVMEGRTGSLAAAKAGPMVVGTQVRGANDYTVGIECEGTYNTVLPPRSLQASLVVMCAWLCTRYDLDPRTAIVPHMKFNDTDCCGYRFAPTLPKLRAQVAAAMKARPTR
jgi:hypothetical protein